jgi:hypothetical protein
MLTAAKGVSNSGLVVGFYSVHGNGFPPHGFEYNAGSFTPIAFPGAYLTDGVFGINNSGTAVGVYEPQRGSLENGFVYSGGSFAAFNVPSAILTEPFAINDSGWIVGFYDDAKGNGQGFLYNGVSFSTLDFPGAILSQADGINNAHIHVFEEHSVAALKAGIVVEEESVTGGLGVSLGNQHTELGLLTEAIAQQIFFG